MDLHSETECSFESGVLLLITQKALTSTLVTLTSPLQSTHPGPGISGERERQKGLCQVLTLAEDGLTYKMQNNKVHQELRQQNSANINRKIPDSAKMLDLTSVQTQYKHCTAP